jgi:hypothetical protein
VKLCRRLAEDILKSCIGYFYFVPVKVFDQITISPFPLLRLRYHIYADVSHLGSPGTRMVPSISCGLWNQNEPWHIFIPDQIKLRSEVVPANIEIPLDLPEIRILKTEMDQREIVITV